MKKIKIYLIPISFFILLIACNKSNSDEMRDESFRIFLESFPEKQLPVTFDIKYDESHEHWKTIGKRPAIGFLGKKFHDEENGMLDSENRYVMKFPVGEGKTGVVYRCLDLPVGSGSNISYDLLIFDEQGKKISEKTIFILSGWNRGYVEQSCTINKDLSIDADYNMEEENAALFISRKEKAKIKYQISDNGIIEEEKEILSRENKSMVDIPFEVKDLKKHDVPDMIKKDYPGSFITGKNWQDKLGNNYLIFSKMETKSKENPEAVNYALFVVHYLDVGKKYPEVLWKTQDFENQCMFDSQLRFIPEGISITDLDKDKIAETTYLYTLGCVSDVSPFPMKLIMHEETLKMAIRGNVRLKDMEEFSQEPDYVIDEKSFEGLPDEFKYFSKGQWLIHDLRGF